MELISQIDLERAAVAVTKSLKTIPEFSVSRIVVIGGMAVVNCLPATMNRIMTVSIHLVQLYPKLCIQAFNIWYRMLTVEQDVDFINTTNAPKDVKDELLGLRESIDNDGKFGKYCSQLVDAFN